MKVMRLFCAIGLIVLASCNEDATEIGSDFFHDGQLDISYIDSATVKLSTVALDDNATNSASRLLLGYHEDAKMGKFSASVFFRVELSSAVDLSEVNSELLYAALHLEPDTYSYYDTLTQARLHVFPLTESIELTDGVISNSDSFQTGDELGAVTFEPRPNRMDSLEIRLSDSFSTELYARAKSADAVLQTDAAFAKYIRGFAVQPEPMSGAILGFTSGTMALRLYYFDKASTPARLSFLSFPLKSTYYSNWISSDRTNTILAALEDIEPTERLDSDLTGEQAFIQGGTTLALRVDVPYLRNLKQLSNFFITRAVLEIWPVEDSFDESTPLPATLTGAEVDYRNSRYNDAVYGLALNEDNDLGRDTHYEVDVTTFVKAQMELAQLNENALFVFLGSEYSAASANRLYIASPGLNKKTKLRIYYATIND